MLPGNSLWERKREKTMKKQEKRGKRGKVEQMRVEVYLMHYNFISVSSPVHQTKITTADKIF